MATDAFSLWASIMLFYETSTKKPAVGVANENDMDGQNSTLSAFLQRLRPSACLCGTQSSEHPLGAFGFGDVANLSEIKLDDRIPQLLEDMDAEDAIAMDEQQWQQQQYQHQHQHEHQSRNHRKKRSAVQLLEDKRVALEQLYELTCIKENRSVVLFMHETQRDLSMCRVPIICTCKWDIIPPLAECLLIERQKDRHSDVRRLACLVLNNLSIPFENKNVMIHGIDSDLLIDTLVEVIRMRVPETYLCCITLMNLTYLKDAVEPIITYSPQHKQAQQAAAAAAGSHNHQYHHHNQHTPNMYSSAQKKRPRSAQKTRSSLDPREWDSFPAQRTLTPGKMRQPTPPRQLRSNSNMPWLDDPTSLLRSLERLMRDQQPFLMSTVMSAESESIRWSIGLLRNLTKKDRHCAMVARTDIPAMVLSFLEKSPRDIVTWTKDSLEDQALGLLGQLAVSKESSGVLHDMQIVVILERIQRGAGATQSPCTVMVRDKISSILGSMERNRYWYQ